MKRNSTLWVTGVLLAALFSGCRQDDGVTEIVCDTNNAIEINPFEADFLEEVILDPSPLTEPKHVELSGDGGVYFHAGDTLYRYSLQDGRKELVYGRRGRAKNEYIRLWEYWMDGEDLCMYDLDTHRILRYSPDGVLKDVKELIEGVNQFQLLCRLDEEHWIARMTYRGVPGETTELALFDNNIEFMHTIGEGKLLSGMRIGYHFCKNPEGVLFIGPLSDKIWQVNENESYVKYRVVFTNGSLKLENYSDEFQLYGDLMQELDKRDFSFSVTGLHLDGKYLGFEYQSSRKKAMYALYDQETGETYCFNIVLPEGWKMSDAVLSDGKVRFVCFGDDAGTRIWTANLNDLLSKAGK